ncbi:bifunctional oligoribonuclease/PAP phosphatase NrnA [Crocinitomicaceae bacterium CZZ-1]|uniref:Bifunctional oligoribonuclease/PAP phosphatase NrnA n=1 Tax=Taishania pollutisoli TaxID=2766479 RepID=A0A8J6PEV6_9FLAO|nr:bifunctional oligoribonuclease/PAP phosphatase NrnA [Taishania pollutisoli]MBC9813228.1 bifunctional oligoribonuclease/PAP phosphatase NrnA [Taishania pollutisoli]MBX2950508.1 bifunctional oligoribonuclease/PAP phosphatase NrnA [Crocinitomicaceae bacterium]
MTIYQQIADTIAAANNIVITAHKSPDGDSVGSSIGLYRFIQKLQKNVSICHPDKAPSFLHWLEDLNDILVFEEDPEAVEQKVHDADLLICLDYNDFSRVGKDMQNVLEHYTGKIILIDHHLHPAPITDLMLSDTTVCSTCQLVYEVIRQSDKAKLLDAHIATPLYLGIVTDTGSFRFPSVEPRTHQIVAEMLELGVVHYKVHENTFDNNTVDKLKLRGYATSEKLEIIHNNRIAIIALSQEELNRFNYQKGDTEGLVNVALSIDGVKAAVLLTEQNDQIRMSFRGKDDYEVNIIAAEQFGGGGHKYAAGGSSTRSLEDTIEQLKQEIPTYFA